MLEGLRDRPNIRRPPLADELYCQVVEETLEQEPSELGYNFTAWIIRRLNQNVSQVTGKEISDERLRLILLERGWVYRHPKDYLEVKQDKEVRKRAAEFLEELKKGRSSRKMSSSYLWTKRS